MGLKRESLVPAELVWPDTARFALTPDESANSTQSHVVQLGNFHTGMTGFDCSNDTFAQIVPSCESTIDSTFSSNALVHRFDEIDHMGGIHFC